MPSVPSPLERALDSMKKDIIAAFVVELEKIHRAIEDLEPRGALPPLPSPLRDSDFTRDPNVAFCLRKAIDEANATIPSNAPK